ncbi:hypothetical protein SHKM778_77780 [Streptomyces sp. KM77-8]|uniref:Restriction endonuclease domain-containing protein n=1 Tax=Streptomyces haneummycinicus TaxID=3074435 RepID=A0AAT9HVT0_9ACTN
MWRATEMTAVDERGMTRFFEEFEAPEGSGSSFSGEIVMMASPDLVHNLIVADVQDQIPRRSWARLQTQDVDIVGEASEPVPDLVVLDPDVLPASGRLLPSGSSRWSWRSSPRPALTGTTA